MKIPKDEELLIYDSGNTQMVVPAGIAIVMAFGAAAKSGFNISALCALAIPCIGLFIWFIKLGRPYVTLKNDNLVFYSPTHVEIPINQIIGYSRSKFDASITIHTKDKSKFTVHSNRVVSSSELTDFIKELESLKINKIK